MLADIAQAVHCQMVSSNSIIWVPGPISLDICRGASECVMLDRELDHISHCPSVAFIRDCLAMNTILSYHAAWSSRYLTYLCETDVE